jgi:hypothetical protein
MPESFAKAHWHLPHMRYTEAPESPIVPGIPRDEENPPFARIRLSQALPKEVRSPDEESPQAGASGIALFQEAYI